MRKLLLIIALLTTSNLFCVKFGETKPNANKNPWTKTDRKWHTFWYEHDKRGYPTKALIIPITETELREAHNNLELRERIYKNTQREYHHILDKLFN